MQIMLSVLRATHCRSTHHYIAINALERLKTVPAKRLGTLLLKYHDDYLDGTKAPDARFKEVQNHVAHVRESDWGGTADKCHEWLTTARDYLNEGRWKKAAYACGVLSHYFTDPIMPLHNAQSAREPADHRPIQWSVFKSFDTIFQLSRNSQSSAEFQFASDEDWIDKAVLAVAQVSNRHYHRLLELYDLRSAVEAPYYGLNSESREIFSSLFTLAIDGWAAVLTRLADEATIDLPAVSINLPSVLAMIDMPLAWLVNRLSDAAERRTIKAIIKEGERSGWVGRHPPEEIRVVQQEKALEANGGSISQEPHRSNDRNTRIISPINSEPGSKSLDDPQSSLPASTSMSATKRPRAPDDVQLPDTHTHSLANDKFDQMIEKSAEVDSPVFLSLAEARTRANSRGSGRGFDPARQFHPSSASLDIDQATREQAERQLQSLSTDSTTDAHSKASQLGPIDDVQANVFNYHQGAYHDVDMGCPLINAPSIGPKTAKRFEKIGVRTIGQFVAINPDELESRLATRWITAAIIGDWQDQARLVCEVPILSGTPVELLVAIGCRTAWQLRTSNPKTLATQLVQFCQTSEGQQLLGSKNVPTANDTAAWIEFARSQARRKAA